MATQPDSQSQPSPQPLPAPKPLQPALQKRKRVEVSRRSGILAIAAAAICLVTFIATGAVKIPGLDIVTSIWSVSPDDHGQTKPDDFSRGRIGVTIRDLSQEVAASMSLQTKRTDGIVVVKVWPNSSAEKAGLLNGDIIVAIEGIPVIRGAEFGYKIEYTPLNQMLTLIVERAGALQAVPVRVERWCTKDEKVSDLCSGR
jgi:S1-C subfamily serine protease